MGAAHLIAASNGPPPDAGMKASQQAEKPENENGFTKLKPSPATGFLTCEQQMGWRGGETFLAILFLFFAKSVTFRGVFFINVIYVTTWAQYHPLIEGIQH